MMNSRGNSVNRSPLASQSAPAILQTSDPIKPVEPSELDEQVYKDVKLLLERQQPFFSLSAEKGKKLTALGKVVDYLYKLYQGAISTQFIKDASLAKRFILSRKSTFINDCQLLLCHQALLCNTTESKHSPLLTLRVNGENIAYSAIVDIYRLYFNLIYDKALLPDELLLLLQLVKNENFSQIILFQFVPFLRQSGYQLFAPLIGIPQQYLAIKNLEKQLPAHSQNPFQMPEVDAQKYKCGLLLTAIAHLCRFDKAANIPGATTIYFYLLITHQLALHKQDFSTFDTFPANKLKSYNPYLAVYRLYVDMLKTNALANNQEFTDFVSPVDNLEFGKIDESINIKHADILQAIADSLSLMEVSKILFVPPVYDKRLYLTADEALSLYSPQEKDIRKVIATERERCEREIVWATEQKTKLLNKLDKSVIEQQANSLINHRILEEQLLTQLRTEHFHCLIMAFIYGDEKSFIGIFQAWYNYFLLRQKFMGVEAAEGPYRELIISLFGSHEFLKCMAQERETAVAERKNNFLPPSKIASLANFNYQYDIGLPYWIYERTDPLLGIKIRNTSKPELEIAMYYEKRVIAGDQKFLTQLNDKKVYPLLNEAHPETEAFMFGESSAPTQYLQFIPKSKDEYINELRTAIFKFINVCFPAR